MIELTRQQQNYLDAVGLSGIISTLRCNIRSGLPCFDRNQLSERLTFWLAYKEQSEQQTIA